MSSKLDQLKSMTDVVADTGDIEAIRRFHPQGAKSSASFQGASQQRSMRGSRLTPAPPWRARAS